MLPESIQRYLRLIHLGPEQHGANIIRLANVEIYAAQSVNASRRATLLNTYPPRDPPHARGTILKVVPKFEGSERLISE